MQEQKKTSPLVWIAVGCGLVVLIGIVLVGALGFWGYRWGKDLEQSMRDPTAREQKVLSVLGAERLPDGYHAAMGMSIPFAMDMAMLTDVPITEDSGNQGHRPAFNQRGLLYIETVSSGKQRGELEDFFEGRSDGGDALRRTGFNFKRGKIIARGSVNLPGVRDARYIVQPGGLEEMSRRDDDTITTTVRIECPGDGRLRLGMWFGPAPPAAAEEGATPDFTGTNGDPAEIERFFGHFRPCGSS